MRNRRKESTKTTKDAVINIRVSEADKERYEAEAKRFGMSTSKYILYSVDHKAIHVVEGGVDLANAMYDLNCTMNKFEARDNVSVDELRRALSICVDKMNHFMKTCGG